MRRWARLRGLGVIGIFLSLIVCVQAEGRIVGGGADAADVGVIRHGFRIRAARGWGTGVGGTAGVI